jgi:hypothetical protein
VFTEGPMRMAGWHLLGTARMGTDPQRSVVNEWGRSHDVKNLFIVDGSVHLRHLGRREPHVDDPGAGAVHRRRDEAAALSASRVSLPSATAPELLPLGSASPLPSFVAAQTQIKRLIEHEVCDQIVWRSRGTRCAVRLLRAFEEVVPAKCGAAH